MHLGEMLRLIEKEFSEGDHPRDDHGEFTSGGGGSSSAATHSPAKAPAEAKSKPQKPKVDKAKVTKDQAAAIKTYQGKDYLDMNKAARGQKTTGKMSDADAQKHTEHLDAAIKAHTVQNNSVVYRGLGPGVSVDHLKQGDMFRDRGFVSTSSSVNVAKNFTRRDNVKKRGTLMHISVPAGTNALPMEHHSHKFNEHELVLPRNSFFKVTKVVRDHTGHVTEMHMELHHVGATESRHAA